jgi:hypothetical protein
VFNLHRTDGKFERVIWHPKREDFLATAVGNDVEIWQITPGKDRDP